MFVVLELSLFVILSVVDVGFVNAELELPSGRVPPGEVLGFQTVTELMKEPEVDHRWRFYKQREVGGKKESWHQVQFVSKLFCARYLFSWTRKEKFIQSVGSDGEQTHTVTYSRANQNPMQAVRQTKCFCLYVY